MTRLRAAGRNSFMLCEMHACVQESGIYLEHHRKCVSDCACLPGLVSVIACLLLVPDKPTLIGLCALPALQVALLSVTWACWSWVASSPQTNVIIPLMKVAVHVLLFRVSESVFNGASLAEQSQRA